jgi:hypothetical protein
MSSPPRTPVHRPASSHRRQPSSLDMSHTTSSRRYSANRRSSGYSVGIPLTPRSNQDFEHGSPAQNFDGASDGGLGNLADELGDVWSEDDEGPDEEYAEDMELPEGMELQEEVNKIGMALDHDGSLGFESGSPVAVNGVRDSGVAMEKSSPVKGSKTTLSPQAARQNGKRHQRARSLYDGSDYGDDSDLEGNEGISAGLESRMAAVESLARRGLEENGSPSDQAVQRVVERLKDLGSQTSIENGATRYVQPEPPISIKLTRYTQTQNNPRRPSLPPNPPIPPTNFPNLFPLRPARRPSLPHRHRRTHPPHHNNPRTPTVLFPGPSLLNVPAYSLDPRTSPTPFQCLRLLAHEQTSTSQCRTPAEEFERAVRRVETGAGDERKGGGVGREWRVGSQTQRKGSETRVWECC